MTGYTDNLSVERGLIRPSTNNVTVKVAEFLPRVRLSIPFTLPSHPPADPNTPPE